MTPATSINVIIYINNTGTLQISLCQTYSSWDKESEQITLSYHQVFQNLILIF